MYIRLARLLGMRPKEIQRTVQKQFKVLPFSVHSAGDYLAAALLLAAPWTLNFADGDTGITAFYVVAGIAVLGVSLITNYQYSPNREWSATGAAPSPA